MLLYFSVLFSYSSNNKVTQAKSRNESSLNVSNQTRYQKQVKPPRKVVYYFEFENNFVSCRVYQLPVDVNARWFVSCRAVPCRAV